MKCNLSDIKSRARDCVVFRGCSDGSDGIAYSYYYDELSKIKEAVAGKNWILTLYDFSFLKGFDYDDVLKEMLKTNNISNVKELEIMEE